MYFVQVLRITSIPSYHQAIKKVHGIWLLQLESTTNKVSKMGKIEIFWWRPSEILIDLFVCIHTDVDSFMEKLLSKLIFLLNKPKFFTSHEFLLIHCLHNTISFLGTFEHLQVPLLATLSAMNRSTPM